MPKLLPPGAVEAVGVTLIFGAATISGGFIASLFSESEVAFFLGSAIGGTVTASTALSALWGYSRYCTPP